MNYSSEITIGPRKISINHPTYFIADIASNHDGDLSRAKELIWKSKEVGADAVKFQHFKADRIVSDIGFKQLGNQDSHQSKWEKSVYEVFKQYELNRDWNLELIAEAEQAKIEFFTTPYDLAAVDEINDYLPAYKIGSGDITWNDFIEYIAKKRKPTLLATGASDFTDVKRAVASITNFNPDIVLMQCNTNYTGDLENFKYINLNVLKTYSTMYPNMILGLSDHTPGHATVLGSIALGARVIEKHFTDDNNRVGPDHSFSMNPVTWSDMVERARELEFALGDGIKVVEENEKETVVLQRRGIYLKKDMRKGQILRKDDIEFLRPAHSNGYFPYELESILGSSINNNKELGQPLYKGDF
ncbi:N-acetylneuraminate synthase family protein [Metabacillus fastidiosus]|uniref:N-acetylneuraminate synthase family protein n=1 Tax=Metabacillus fastidiosus TaxID=1458 RepID=UPI002DBCCF6D|nr:N-acetylneuraminate synthase family protein [Metabacillus fastidiosus]MEC2077310.1 N-acetylneuraminate synthase family protein [Metabacillus fastidiosus]